MKEKLQKYKIKKGDEVCVISGSDKGKCGKVLEILRKKNRIVVEGVAIKKKTQRPSQDNPEGGIVEIFGSVHYSNVVDAKRYNQRKVRKIEKKA